MGTELKSEGLSEPTKNKIVQKLKNKMDSEEKEEPMLDDIPTEKTTDEPVEAMGGLMARRT